MVVHKGIIVYCVPTCVLAFLIGVLPALDLCRSQKLLSHSHGTVKSLNQIVPNVPNTEFDKQNGM